MLEIARPAGEYEVSRLRSRQGSRVSPVAVAVRRYFPEGADIRSCISLVSLPRPSDLPHPPPARPPADDLAFPHCLSPSRAE